MGFFTKNWWKILLILLAIIVVAVFIYGYKMGLNRLPWESLEPVPAPLVNDKIKGYWSSESGRTLSELDDAEAMKEVGINTITFSPMLTHDQEGRVSEIAGTENFVKKAINKAHQNGFRVMLETTPMNAGVVDPKVTNPDLFTGEMTKMALKYAKIAEDYHVEYFAPIVEPGHHLSIVEADRWLQELLPKLKAVYHGKIMWKKQATDLEQPKEWLQDHILITGFKLEEGGFKLKLKAQPEQSISLDISSEGLTMEKYAHNSPVFRESKNYPLSEGWHELKIEIKGKLIVVSVDSEKLIEKNDDDGPLGGYLLSGRVRINKLEIIDVDNKVLYQETFNNLNSFSALSGIALENSEMVVSTESEVKQIQNEVKLIYDVNYSGYDYIAIDTFRRGRTMGREEYVNFLRYVIQKANDQAESDNVPNVILAEYGGSLKENIGWKDPDERDKIPLTEDELAQTVKMVLELAEQTTDGYIYNGWDIEKQGLNDLPKVKAVVKDWYNSH